MDCSHEEIGEELEVKEGAEFVEQIQCPACSTCFEADYNETDKVWELSPVDIDTKETVLTFGMGVVSGGVVALSGFLLISGLIDLITTAFADQLYSGIIIGVVVMSLFMIILGSGFYAIARRIQAKAAPGA